MYFLSSFIIHSLRNPLSEFKHIWWLLLWSISRGSSVSNAWVRSLPPRLISFPRLTYSPARNSKSYNATKQHKKYARQRDVNSIPFKIFVKRKTAPPSSPFLHKRRALSHPIPINRKKMRIIGVRSGRYSSSEAIEYRSKSEKDHRHRSCCTWNHTSTIPHRTWVVPHQTSATK